MRPTGPGPTAPSGQPSGLLVAVCAGHRCAALRARTGRADDLRLAVRTTPGGVLVAADCLGPCHLASLAVVARRVGSTGISGPGIWLSGIDQPSRAAALRDWVVDGGPAGHDPASDLPGALAEAVVALVAQSGPPDGRRPPR